jgi:ribosomal protein L11 methyltransferase
MKRRRAGTPSARPRREARRRWGVLVVEAGPALTEELAVLLGDEGLGSETRDLDDGRTEVRLYFASLAVARAKRQQLTGWFEGRERATARVRVEEVEDLRWVETYQAGLRPFELGRRFRVHPEPGEGPVDEPDGRIAIRLVPGQAFGTGEHSTTRLCAALLLDEVGVGGERWLDLGCGTAILSIVAHHLGAAHVRAYDIDPDAVSVAREVLAANRLGDVVTVTRGSVSEVEEEGWDGIVANIELPFFENEASNLAALLRPGGRLIASGFLRSDVEAVGRRFFAAGLGQVRTAVEEPWAAVLARRGGA